MSGYYKDQSLIKEDREMNVRNAYKKLQKLEQEVVPLRKCKDALEAMLKCPLIQDAGFVPYIESVLGLWDNYVIRSEDED